MRFDFQPGETWSFEDLAPNTIALDGAVQGPRVDNERRLYSFDHHGDCLRYCTTATCRQVLDALLLGLDPTDMTVLVNDIDGDTILSVWLLQHAAWWRGDPAALARIRPLVEVVALGDAHGPAYPLPNEDLAYHFHRTVSAPWRIAHNAKEPMTRAHLDACLAVLEAWWQAGLVPEPQEVLPSPEAIVTEHGSWVFAFTVGDADGSELRLAAGLYKQGHDRLVLGAPASLAGHYRYTLAKRSDFVSRFDLARMFAALNAAEQENGGLAGWGGASTIGGAPRPEGSRLDPAEVMHIVSTVVQESR